MDDVKIPDTGYEKRDANFRGILLFGSGLVLVTVAAFIAMWAMFNRFAAREAQRDVPVSPLTNERKPSTAPKLQTDPPKEIAELRALEEKLLNSYEWVNETVGIARIPIDRAMALLAEKGLPTRSEVKADEKAEK